MTTLMGQYLALSLAVFGLGCAILGFFFGHTVKTERGWQKYVDSTIARRDGWPYPGERLPPARRCEPRHRHRRPSRRHQRAAVRRLPLTSVAQLR